MIVSPDSVPFFRSNLRFRIRSGAGRSRRRWWRLNLLLLLLLLLVVHFLRRLLDHLELAINRNMLLLGLHVPVTSHSWTAKLRHKRAHSIGGESCVRGVLR